MDAATDTSPAASRALLLIAASTGNFVMLGPLFGGRLPSCASFLRCELLGMASRRVGNGNAQDSKEEPQ